MLTKEEAVQKATTKWEHVSAMLIDLSSAVHRPCDLCTYYEECDDCPLGNRKLGRADSQNCNDYFRISELVEDIRQRSSRVLETIKNIEVCNHLDEYDVTTRGDDKRYFRCSSCGRHRTEEY